MRSAVFLDRDGVINRATILDGKSYPPQSFDEFEFLPGVEDAIRELSVSGLLVVVVTNQPDVATGKQLQGVVEEMHSFIKQHLPIDDIQVCYHSSDMGCNCRKPNAGMLKNAAKSLNIDLAKSYMVGDRWRDVEAGNNAGCRKCYFIDYGYAEQKPVPPFETVRDLADAAARILSSHVDLS
ncbi:HAD-IIIA family hydrolase [Thalassospira lucentensis]|uniref:D-glycero-alpha-D-manno-heptose-1,7-bisphosphate 7-phosphatase n=1 Tax=Thalassospira lucentensis TaxID=168935 RepID=UPI002942CF6D|nr:HAD-IIIA family hydrolase [Thalassospira lucentensis]WOI11830.1 HAD-IIIA family hydrolase [Thalassospira lucentensis]